MEGRLRRPDILIDKTKLYHIESLLEDLEVIVKDMKEICFNAYEEGIDGWEWLGDDISMIIEAMEYMGDNLHV